MFDEIFKRLGFTKNEQKIYLYLLAHGASLASMIAKRIGVKRVTVYAALESLEKKNFLTSYTKNDVTYFEAFSAEKLKQVSRERIAREEAFQKEIEKALPFLKELELDPKRPRLELRGNITYYQGIEAVKHLIDETLAEKSKKQYCFGLNYYHIHHTDSVWRAYTHKRVSLGMKVWSIQPATADAIEYQKRDAKELRKTRLVPADTFPAECELNIIGDMIAIFTAQKEEPVGIKFYHKAMASALTSLFKLAWERAEQYDPAE